MNEFLIDQFPRLEPLWTNQEFQLFGRVLLASLLGGILGWERESKGKSAGLRTHILVSVASALFASAAHAVGAADDNADVLRVVPAVATGIGFLGAGLIFVQHADARVHGLTTAASVWATAAVGMATGLGYYWLAAGSTLLVWMVLAVVAWLEFRYPRSRRESHSRR